MLKFPIIKLLFIKLPNKLSYTGPFTLHITVLIISTSRWIVLLWAVDPHQCIDNSDPMIRVEVQYLSSITHKWKIDAFFFFLVTYKNKTMADVFQNTHIDKWFWLSLLVWQTIIWWTLTIRQIFFFFLVKQEVLFNLY